MGSHQRTGLYRSLLLGCLPLLSAAGVRLAASGPPAPPSLREIPTTLSFEPATGSDRASDRFLARGKGYLLSLRPDEAELRLVPPDAQREVQELRAKLRYGAELAPRALALMGHPSGSAGTRVPEARLRLKLLGANPTVKGVGEARLAERRHDFRGSDASKWRRDIPTFGKVEFPEVYPGVDAVYYGSDGRLEYDFVVAPGADPDQIRLAVEGADQVTLDGTDLVMRVPGGEIRQPAPFVYQEREGRRVPVEGRYELLASNNTPQVRFQLGEYDRNSPLVIDPEVAFSSYLGGSANEATCGVAYDPQGGGLWIVGTTLSPNFPASNTLTGTTRGSSDLFLTHLTAGRQVDFSAIFGGSGQEFAGGVRVDSEGNCYVAGTTFSGNFPTTPGAFQPSVGSGFRQTGFVSKVNVTGNLVYSTTLGGTNGAVLNGIAVDSIGNAYVTGNTISGDYPTTPGVFQPSRPEGQTGSSGVVTAINPTGTGLVFSTFLSGNQGFTGGISVAVDGDGNIFVAGQTGSETFPMMNPAQPTYGGGPIDGFLTKLGPGAVGLQFSTFIGGPELDAADALAVDPLTGNVWIGGLTDSPTFPVVDAPGNVSAGHIDTFFTGFRPDGTIFRSQFLGGSGNEFGTGIQVTGSQLFLGGYTDSPDFPVVDPLQPFGGGPSDSFFTVFTLEGGVPGPAPTFSTYFGGSGADVLVDIDVAPGADRVCGGIFSNSTDISLREAIQLANGGGDDSLIVEISNDPPCEVPHRPVITSAEIVTGPKVRLTWTQETPPPVDEFEVFEIVTTDQGGQNVPIVTVNGSERTVEFDYREPTGGGTILFLAILARNSCGDSGRSEVVQVVAGTDTLGVRKLTIRPARLRGGRRGRGTVKLDGTATADTTVELEARTPGAGSQAATDLPVTVPATVVVRQGQSKITFPIRTRRVRRRTVVEIVAHLNGTTQTSRLTLTPR